MILKPKLELLIATSNPGKVRELQEVLRELPVSLRHLAEFPSITAVEETGSTYEDNAILKALAYSEQTGMCALTDDSGLEVDALGGKPGVLSARFGGEGASDRDRTRRLLKELLPYKNDERKARFVCCVAFAGWPQSDCEARRTTPQVLRVEEGRCEGVITPEARGAMGFGYDPIFIPDSYNETFGELPAHVKRILSHRGKALSKMRLFLDQFLKQT